MLGHVVEFARHHNRLFQRGYAEHGDVFRIRLGPRSAAVVSGAEHNAVCYRETDKLLEMAPVYRFLRACFGDAFFTVDAAFYRNQRPVLQQTFSRERLARYVVAMHAEISRWVDSLGDRGRFDISAEMRSLAQAVAGHALFGPDFRRELTPEFWQLYEALADALDPVLPPWLPTPKFRARDRARARMLEIFGAIIAARRAASHKSDDIVSELLTTPQADGCVMSDAQIIDYFVSLLFAGHETTAGQAAWTVIQLLQHPDWLKLVRADVDEVLGSAVPDRAEVLRGLQRVYWSVDETSRMRPAADMLLRLVRQDVKVGRFVIPRGWLMIVNAANSHFLQGAFKDPARYDPERFSRERDEGRGYALVGFGGGVHKCTGMNFARHEMAIVTALLLHRYELSLETQDVRVVARTGPNRPSPAWVAYSRREPHGVRTVHGEHASQAAL